MLCPRKFSIYRCFAEKTVFEVLEKPAFPGKFLLTNIKNHLISNKVSYHNINLSIFILNLIMPLLLFHDGGRYTETSPLILLCKSMDWFLYDNGLLHERVEGINSFHGAGLFLYHLNTSERLWFSYVFRGCRKNQ